MNYINVELPLKDEILKELRVGDRLRLNGYLYTARDAAHKRLYNEFYQTGKFPFELKGETIYYVGPCPSKPNEIIGSAGPTTSGRMDAYTPLLIENGLKGMLGKGNRDNMVIKAMKEHNSVYLGVIGGIGALLKDCVKEVQIVCYDDLGTEAIRRLRVKDFPCIVAIDSFGDNIYEIEPKKYKVKGNC